MSKTETILSIILAVILSSMATNYLKRTYVLTAQYNGVIVTEILTKWMWEK